MSKQQMIIDCVLDEGTIVQLIGRLVEGNRPAIVNFDHRPFSAFWEGWRLAGKPQPVTFDADRGTINFDGKVCP